MSLILIFHNDGTGGQHDANYDVEVLIGDGTVDGSRTLSSGRVEGHDRAQEWDVLVSRYLREEEHRRAAVFVNPYKRKE